jgi:superfamily II DNA or RNA helicase
MPKIEISSDLRIHKECLDLEQVRRKFRLDNPAYQKAKKLGKSTWGISPSIHLFNIVNQYVHFPRGCIKDHFSMCHNIEIIDHTVTNPAQLPGSNIHLRDFQKEAVQKLLQRNQLVLHSPSGSGKTVILLYTIAMRGQKSLVFVHTRDLAVQWRDRCKKFLNFEPGIISSDQVKIKDITIAMVQSLNKPLSIDFVNRWGLIALDECHHTPAISFNRLVQQFPARYRYGCSATIGGRSDGQDFMIPAVFGGIVKVNQEELFKKNHKYTNPHRYRP